MRGSARKWSQVAFKNTGPTSVGTRTTADKLHTFTGTLAPVRRRPRPATVASIHSSTSARHGATNQSCRRGGSGSRPTYVATAAAHGVQHPRRPGRLTERPPGQACRIVGRALAHLEPVPVRRDSP